MRLIPMALTRFFAFWLILCGTALAEMRVYVLPIVVAGQPPSRKAKYLSSMPVTWGMIDYGAEPVAIAAADVDAIQHATIVANPDVLPFPVDLDSQFSALAVTSRAALEAVRIPAGFIVSSTTYRQAIRMCAGMFRFLHRYKIASGLTLFALNTLDTRWNQLTAAEQDGVLKAAAEVGLSTSFITNTTLIREIIEAFGQTWGITPLFIAGLQI